MHHQLYPPRENGTIAHAAGMRQGPPHRLRLSRLPARLRKVGEMHLMKIAGLRQRNQPRLSGHQPLPMVQHPHRPQDPLQVHTEY